MKIEGRNSVCEALNSDAVTVNCLMCEKGNANSIVALARRKGVKVTFVDRSVLDKESLSGKHQGYIADVTDFRYCEIEDILESSEQPFVVILDGINDPHNFGSIIRVCECAGVDGIIIGRNRQVAVTDTVTRCSAGAVSHVKIARVTNVNNAIKQLQENGVWVYALDMDGEEITSVNLRGAIALVVGGEGDGVSRLTRDLCDGVASLKLKGKVNSLNASVACGIALYEAVRQRG
ncbi:MAG: 23S rRNA (guanosine(2251)-2'-O)-methyltransferase RlmB [Corallococcus sp.]|nr:23S rRNA (guanosine(2251)-2'-O)-methyltransferase RlmB [Bacillota bacterium]MCM1533833.1 23S rRNA (guanosine(2251)-2'-O)-methyltransferase RlmB [Corallococcus sp.]